MLHSCHLPPVGGEIRGSETDGGEAHTRKIHTGDRCGKILGHAKQSSTLLQLYNVVYFSGYLCIR